MKKLYYIEAQEQGFSYWAETEYAGDYEVPKFYENREKAEERCYQLNKEEKEKLAYYKVIEVGAIEFIKRYLENLD